MKRGLDRQQPKADKRSILSSSTATHYQSDSSDNDDQNGGCLGGLISSLLGGGGAGGEPLTMSKAATNDDPTTLVAQELNKLSLQEREVVYEDLHGVSMVEDESNLELVNCRLDDMKSELDKIPRSKKTAYLIAMEDSGEKGKEFCQDRSLNLMFLRADRWNPQKAAERFVGWMDWKLKLFGRDILCHRHVILDDLEKDGRATVQAGRIQILPQRDTSGRTVLFDLQTHQSQMCRSVKSMLEMFWYMLMAAVEDDVQAQRTGIVYIIYSIGGPATFNRADREIFWDASRMVTMLPVRICSVHYCFNDPKIGPVITLIQTAAGSYIRARFRSHEGTHTEVQYRLMTFGVPTDVLPIATDGNLKAGHHSKWYKRRKIRDTTLAQNKDGDCEVTFEGIDLPGRFDVLLGKGKPIQESPGNRRLQELVRIYYEEYDTSGHGGKQLLAEKLVKLIQDPSSSESPSTVGADPGHTSVVRVGASRFLKRRSDGWWEPVPHKIAIEKVCHAFRAFRLSMAKLNATKGTSAIEGTNTKRFKVETQEVEPEAPLISSNPSLVISEGGDFEPLQGFTSVVHNVTEQDGLDLDSFDWADTRSGA